MAAICPNRKPRSTSKSGDYRRLKALAGERGVAPAQPVREAVAEYVGQARCPTSSWQHRQVLAVNAGISANGQRSSLADFGADDPRRHGRDPRPYRHRQRITKTSYGLYDDELTEDPTLGDPSRGRLPRRRTHGATRHRSVARRLAPGASRSSGARCGCWKRAGDRAPLPCATSRARRRGRHGPGRTAPGRRRDDTST